MDENIPQDRNLHPTLGVIGLDSGEVRVLKFIEGSGINLLPVAVYTWDENILEWTKALTDLSGHMGDLHVTMGDVEKLLAKAYWLRTKVEYDADNNPIYIGRNTSLTAADEDTDWIITRIDWVGGKVKVPLWIEKRVRTSSWIDRAIGW